MSPPRLDEALVRRLVEDHLLRSDDRILEVRIGSAAAIVATSRRSWRLEELDHVGSVPTGTGYRLFGARTATTDSSEPTVGLTQLPDGRVFNLARPDEMGAFNAAVDPVLEAVEAACLVAAFVEPGEQARRVADGRVWPDLPAPTVTSTSADGRTVRVYTARTHFVDDESSVRVVEGWDVTVGTPTLRWTHAEVRDHQR